MIDVRQLIAWSDAMHATWWEGLEELDPEVLDENHEVSFRSILGLLTHMANVEHAWLDVVEGIDVDWARHSTKEWHELAPVRAYVDGARERTHALLDTLDAADLDHPCPVDPEAGFARDAFTVEEVLFTIASHELLHRGELLAILWRRDIQPPLVDYPRYGTPLS